MNVAGLCPVSICRRQAYTAILAKHSIASLLKGASLFYICSTQLKKMGSQDEPDPLAKQVIVSTRPLKKLFLKGTYKFGDR